MRGAFNFSSRYYRESTPLANTATNLLRDADSWVVCPPGAKWEFDSWAEFALTIHRELESRWSDEGQVGTYTIEIQALRASKPWCTLTIIVERP